MTTHASSSIRRWSWVGLSLFLLVALAAGCKHAKKPEGEESEAARSKDPDRNLAVAVVGDTRITVGMLEDELNNQNPYLRMRFASPERRKEFLKNLVRFEVLAQEAKRRGLQRDPEVVRRVKRAMIDRLMEELHTTLVKMESITDKEIADFYKTNINLYKQPAKVRASWILLDSEAEAKKVLAEARKKPTDVAHFGELARKHTTDAATRDKRGDLDFFTRDAGNIPRPVIDAAFAIDGLWQLGGPVKTERGYAVVMKTGEMEAVDRPLEQEKDRIRSRVFNEKRLRAMEKFVEDLQARAKVQIDDKALAKVKVDLSAKPLRPRLSGHGHPGGHPH
jgi:parvulin-like peptidyl-prolyl isomerase